MRLSPNAYALVGLTAIVAVLVSMVTFALLKFLAAARDTRHAFKNTGGELLTSALQDAVTKLKAQERATAARAEASERLSEEIIASITSGLLVVDLSGDIRVLNPAGRQMLGLSATDPAEHYRRVLARAQPLAQVVEECLRTGSAIRRRTIAVERADAESLSFGVTASPLFDEAHLLLGAVCLFTDITAVRDLEEQLRLKDSLARVGELTAGIAHEFRNGLATIHGYSKLIDLGALPESYRPYIEGIRAEAESLSGVVTNFLNFARPAQLSLARIDLGAICERAAEEVRAEVASLGGSIAVRGAFAEIEGDEVLLRQSVSNLLRNAVEACAAASTAPDITIDAEIDAAQRVLRVAVNDNGPGIAPAVRERVFRPFFTSKRNGTGLGLALVQKIVVYHNGRVVVGHAPQGGASLQITLPLIAAPAGSV